MQGKHSGNRSSYIDQRDEELIRAFRKAKRDLLKEKGVVILREALDLARCSPCSRYFVSEQRASDVIRKMMAFDRYIEALQNNEHSVRPEDPLKDMIYMRRRMFSHIYARFKKLKEEFPDKPYDELVYDTCASPAGEFYLTIDSTRAILSRILINFKNNNGHTSNGQLIYGK